MPAAKPLIVFDPKSGRNTNERIGAGVEDIVRPAAGGVRLLPPASRMLRLRQERVLVRRRIDDECAAVAIA